MTKRHLLILAVILAPLFSIAQTSSEIKSTELYVGAALGISTTSPNESYEKNGGKTYTSYLPKIIFGFNAYENPVTRKFYFSAELSASQNKYLSVYDNKVYPYTVITYGFTQTNIALNPQANLNIYNADNFKWLVGAGISLQRNFYSGQKLTAADGTRFADLHEFELAGFQTPVTLKTGVTINKRVQVFADYITPLKVSLDAAYFNITMQTMHVGVNYIL